MHWRALVVTKSLRRHFTTLRNTDMNNLPSISLNTDAKSPFYFASFYGADGKQKRRSTKVPAAGGMYQGRRITAAQAKSIAMRIAAEIANAEQQEYHAADNRTLRQVCDIMLSGKLGRVSTYTYENARTDYRQFCTYLGKKADEPIRLITRADIREWVVMRRQSVRAQTVKKALSVINAAFAWALDSGIITANPCTGVRVPPDTRDEKVIHEAFTLDEVRLLIDKLPDEWSSAVRCCINTYGQRLSDILSLRWDQFDWTSRTVNIITGKTARELHQPMQPSFYDWARERYEAAQAAGGEAAVYVHPTLHRHTNPSAEFTHLVRLHGIGLVGRNAGGNRRTWHSKTFHSLRATVATMLQASGVSQGMAMELVGHDSAAVHAAYIRPTAEQLRDAAAKLPTL